jgi:hypothetical protein
MEENVSPSGSEFRATGSVPVHCLRGVSLSLPTAMGPVSFQPAFLSQHEMLATWVSLSFGSYHQYCTSPSLFRSSVPWMSSKLLQLHTLVPSCIGTMCCPVCLLVPILDVSGQVVGTWWSVLLFTKWLIIDKPAYMLFCGSMCSCRICDMCSWLICAVGIYSFIQVYTSSWYIQASCICAVGLLCQKDV